MISEYVNAALKRAHYEMIEDPEPYHGEIPDCPGVWATGRSLEEFRQNLLEGLEGWLILSLQRDLPIPVIDGIELVAPEPTEVSG